MTENAPKGPYTVGYGKPPVEHQFKPGQSGNKKGRPRSEDRSMSALIKGILGERISVKVGTDKKKMTRKEIMARQIVNEAGKGNFRALKTLLSLTMDRMVEEQEEAHKRARQQEQAALEWEELRKRLNRKVAEKEREAEQRFQAAVDEEVKRRLGMQSDGGDEPHGAAQSIIQEKRSWDPDY